MNEMIEALIRERVNHYHSQWKQYANGYFKDYKLCVVTADCGHPDLPPGTVTIARYFPATFGKDAHCLVLCIRPDSQSKCHTTDVNAIRFCN